MHFPKSRRKQTNKPALNEEALMKRRSFPKQTCSIQRRVAPTMIQRKREMEGIKRIENEILNKSFVIIY